MSVYLVDGRPVATLPILRPSSLEEAIEGYAVANAHPKIDRTIAAFRLIHGHDYTFRSAGELLGVPIGTLHEQITRMQTWLRMALGDDFVPLSECVEREFADGAGI